jgi:hypothetical protein
MMLRNLFAAAVAAVLCLGAGAVFAQTTPTLAELAKKEEARRKAVKGSGKTFTNADLPKSATQAPAAAPGAPAAAASEKKPEAPPKDEPEKDENWWRGRVTTVRESLRRNEMFLDALQTRINSLANDFAGRDDPFQRAKIAEDRLKALNELERVKADIEQDKKQIAAIEEEARQAGVPPGWLR